MKKIYYTIAFVFCAIGVSHAQEDVYKTIAKEACDCLAKKNYDYATASKADVQMALGLCIIESAQRNKVQMDLGNTQAMTELGQKVGMQMAPICPDALRILANTEEQTEPAAEVEDDTEYFTLAGKVKAIEEKDFIYVTLKEASGKEQKFIWLYYFEGSDEFKADPKKLIGKDVAITYIVLEVLQPKSKVYYNLNIISGLEMK